MLLAAPAHAQSADESLISASAAPLPVFMAPVYEGGIRKNRGISIPVNLRVEPSRRLTVGYTASNSYLNTGYITCQRPPACRADYQSDHTGNLLFANLSIPVLRHWEAGLGLATYRMGQIAGWSPVHRLVSDSVLRGFHENILSEDSLPELSNAPDDRQIFSMTDLAGRQLTLTPEHDYLLPLRIDMTRFLSLRETDRARMTLNAGVHMAWPLESALARGVDAGVSANFVHSRRITANVASTWHVQLARFRQDVHVVNPDSPRHGDDLLRSQYALTWGLRFNGTFKGAAPCSFSMSQLSTTAQYDKQTYWSADTVIFEGGNNLRGAILGANDFGVLTYACEYRGRQMQVSIAEDIGGFSQFLSRDGAGTSYDPDLTISVSVSWVPGRGEKAEMPIP